MTLSLFQYSFVLRAFSAGVIVAIIAPLVGIFLVLRRYSLLADTFAHVSLAGLALGLLAGMNPIITALATTVVASLGMERLRVSKKVYGESALAVFLSGSLALATILLSLGRGFNTNLLNYLFGSIVTVTSDDIFVIGTLAVVVIAVLVIFYKELIYVTFDEEAARVSGIPTRPINTVFMILTAVTIALAIPIVGVLLISALLVVPVVASLQLKKNFIQIVIYAEAISLFSVVSGIIVSFYFNLSTGGTIVLVMVAIFTGIFLYKNYSH